MEIAASGYDWSKAGGPPVPGLLRADEFSDLGSVPDDPDGPGTLILHRVYRNDNDKAHGL